MPKQGFMANCGQTVKSKCPRGVNEQLLKPQNCEENSWEGWHAPPNPPVRKACLAFTNSNKKVQKIYYCHREIMFGGNRFALKSPVVNDHTSAHESFVYFVHITSGE